MKAEHSRHGDGIECVIVGELKRSSSATLKTRTARSDK
jgi:hypothetical protein